MTVSFERWLGEGEEELGAVADDPAKLLLRPREEARHVLENDQGDVEGVAEADEPRPFDRGVDVEHAGQMIGLVRDDADGAPAEAGEATTRFFAQSAWISKKSPSSTTFLIRRVMS